MDNLELAKIIHDEWCDLDCRMFSDAEDVFAVQHRQWYIDKANTITEKLAPEIGAANVPFVVKTVLEEFA